MRRTLIVWLLLCACRLPASAQTLQATLKPEEGLADIAVVRKMTMTLSDKPPRAFRREPAYVSTKPLYGSFKLGNGPHSLITAVVDEASLARMYLDSNGDFDLLNDGSAAWDRESPVLYRKETFDVQYVNGSQTETHPYTLMFMRYPSRYPHHVYYFTDSFRLGEIKFGSAARKVAVIDDNADGLFNDLPSIVLLIDTDGDGKLNGRFDSHEWYSAAEPFNIGGKTYEVASLDAPGTRITLRVSSRQVTPKPPLTRGSPALDFTAKDVNGKTVSLSALKGKTVLLVFWSLNDAESWRQLPHIKRVHQTFQEKGLVVIGISQDKDAKALKDFMQDRDVDWTQICDGADGKFALSKLYRVRNLPSHFLIDGKGVIIGLGQRGPDLYNAIEAAVTTSQ